MTRILLSVLVLCQKQQDLSRLLKLLQAQALATLDIQNQLT